MFFSNKKSSTFDLLKNLLSQTNMTDNKTRVDNILAEFEKSGFTKEEWIKMFRAMPNFERCTMCGNLTMDDLTECESDRDYVEKCCSKCTHFCNACNEYYCSKGFYKHEDCLREECCECGNPCSSYPTLNVPSDKANPVWYFCTKHIIRCSCPICGGGCEDHAVKEKGDSCENCLATECFRCKEKITKPCGLYDHLRLCSGKPKSKRKAT